MNIQITGRRLEVSESMKDYATERIERLSRYFDRLNRAQLVLEPKGPMFSAELVVTGPKGTHLAAEAKEESFNAAVDKVMDKIERQITRSKEKMREHRRESSRTASPEPAPAESEDLSDTAEFPAEQPGNED